MTTRYDAPGRVARVGNDVIRRLAEAGVSIAGSTALQVRGRRSGELRSVVVNLLTVQGRTYVVAPRGTTEWVRNARAAGEVSTGPRWRRRRHRVVEVAHDQKPPLLQRYVDRWFWEVKGHIGGLTPQSTPAELRAAAPSIPVFELVSA
ncbi:nitroreductase family deazaflavin-dependent oxidoreductase [Mycobacterium sp. DSM 3803]|nr:nitroreductase family deazaflavin-dependent oxidoreductase [Mycobacterium sp. DSM 3803]